MTKSAQVIEVVVTVSLRGTGSENDPFREVTQYWSPLGGEPLATVDPEVERRARSCRCPAGEGRPCPLTQEECAARVLVTS
jgi:hypothetical protein